MSSKPSPARGPRLVRGISLIESLCAVSIAAAALGSAVPSLHDWRERQALLGAAAELETDIQYARSQAVAANVGLRLSVPELAAGSCYVIHTGDAHDCGCTASGQAVCTDGATALRVVGHGVEGPVKLGNGKLSVLFDPQRGTVTPAATLKLNAIKGGSAVHQVVNIMGRTRSCAAGGSIPGLKAC